MSNKKNYTFQIWTIVLFHCYVLTNGELAPQNGTSDEESFPEKQKCESLLVNCSCYDYVELAGIVCNRMDDFSIISGYLSTNAIFEVNTTYEITFSRVEYLPAAVLKGLIVYRLFLEDPDLAEIDENAFEGTIRLRRFHVRCSKLKAIPHFHKIRNSLSAINIDSSLLTALEGNHLQDLPVVRSLSFVNNSIRYIDPDVFKGTHNIVVFDVSYNLLTFLPPNLIDQWKELKKFVVSYNNLFHMDSIFTVTHPRFIYLDYNNITDVDRVLHYNMSNVETVILAGNPIENITVDSFNKKIPHVRFLYLDHCNIRIVDSRHYENLGRLATLDLSYNFIKEVPKQTIQFGSSLELVLTGNHIKRFDAEVKETVKRLYLDENKLQSLDKTLQHTQIVEVSVARNQIKYLSKEDFHDVHQTANLELQGNKIQRIDRLTFWNIRNDLNYLDLSSNYIASLNGSVKTLSRLKLLNLTDNLIQTFESMEFAGLNELSELYLQHNQIIALGGQLQMLTQLQYLVIGNNNIETLKEQQLPPKLKFIYLAGNPIKCNCALQPFLLWLTTKDSPETDIDVCISKTPRSHDNYVLQSSRCPEMCVCGCKEFEKEYYMFVDCNSKNLTKVPTLLTNNFMRKMDNETITYNFRRSLMVDQNAYPSLHIYDHVLGIGLRNNSLDSLEEAQIPAELIHLDVSDNKLRRIPEHMLYTLQNLKSVSLSQNPWACDCNTLEFRKWLLSNSEAIVDLNATLCGLSDQGESTLSGREISTLTDLDLCPANIGMIVSVAFGILVFLSACLTVRILYGKYELNFKVFLYSKGITWVKQKDIDYEKEFDAFLSFSDKDIEFVTKDIIEVIEKKDPNIRLFIHYRHFKPGEFIQDNIIHAVQNSKRTVLILTKDFLESSWCLFEFRTAHEQSLKDKVHRIIVIKVGELPKDIDPTIKVYLESTTYLTWGEKHFWNNLMYILPTSSSVRNTSQIEKKCVKRNLQMI